MVMAQLRFRRGRVVATLLAVAVAVASFSLLASAARGSQLRAEGTVSQHFRPEYDLLVRPAATTDPVPGRISFDSVASTSGGITLDQWHRIQQVPGVSVAAPVALVGYVMRTVAVPIDLTRYLAAGQRRQVLRARPTWSWDRGLSRFTDGSSYLYVTADRLEFIPGDRVTGGQQFEGEQPQASSLAEVRPDGSRTAVCVDLTHDIGTVDPLRPDMRQAVKCWSSDPASTGNASPNPLIDVLVSVPMLVAAIDPEQEARLNGLDTAVVAGTYLSGSSAQGTTLPVLVSSRPALDQQALVEIDRLGSAGADGVAAGTRFDNLVDGYEADTGTRLGEVTVSGDDAYPRLVQQLLQPLADDTPPQSMIVGGERPTTIGDRLSDQVWIFWSVGPQRPGEATPLTGGEWGLSANDDVPFNPLPLELSDTAVRSAVPHQFVPAPGDSFRPTRLHAVGVFDPGRVDVGSELSAVPADLYRATDAAPADDAARRALNGRNLAPSANFTGPVGPRPQLLTTLDAMPTLWRSQYTNLGAVGGADITAPISSVRVRLTGQLGMDALSKERARAAADQIQQATGLRVDIVLGGSPAEVPTALPAGAHGRPPLRVDQPWLQAGVATVIVAAIDRKSLLLAGLVLVACVLAVANATGAAVRTRVVELGVLACLGWPRRRLFGLVLAESTVVGLIAGVAGTALALAAALPLNVHLRIPYLLLALPAALLLTLLASLVPAWQATRAAPVRAIRPAVARVRAGRVPRRVGGLAWANVLRAPGRTALGALSLALGVAALTLLAVITLSFRGTVTGTLLGDAITVQVQSTDYIAAAITILLGAATVGDVLYVNIRERAAEFALLGAVGWSDRLLGRLAGYEAAILGVCGGVAGAACGLGVAATLNGGLPAVGYAVAATTAVAGVLATAAATVLPLRLLRKLPTARLLAEA
ncbi:ABC transporter permease [Dactylosporangium sp. NPDC000555]|uniref:ABC transporter permease n=1 Tax=Dactylosporangium sp. NPDC000555 TaxID=3154260 RepID=UPI00331F4D40